MKPFKTLTRQALYEQVWSTPISRLAKSFHLSDQGLAKKCKKHNIPRPPVGYWAKLAHDKSVKKTPLPNNQDSTLDFIHFYHNPAHDASAGIHQYRLTDEQLASVLAYRIPTEVKRYHPIISQYRKGFNKKAIDKYGRVYFQQIDTDLHFKVTPKTFNRACLFLHGVIDLFEKNGWTLGKINDCRGTSRCAFFLNDEGLTFEIKERVKQIPHVKTEKEQESRFLWGPKYDFIATGMLEFSIENLYFSGFNIRWSDTEKTQLESRLRSIVQGFSHGFAYVKKRGIENERRRIESEREDAEREEALRIKEIAEQRRHYLIELSNDFKQAELIRQMIGHLKKTQQKEEGLEGWLLWAAQQADALDPTTRQADILAMHQHLAIKKSYY